MLVLTRKKDQVVLIGKDIKVHVIEVRPGVVRLGFEAPRDVQILREEVPAKDVATDIELCVGSIS